jgi:hypothetical protein
MKTSISSNLSLKTTKMSSIKADIFSTGPTKVSPAQKIPYMQTKISNLTRSNSSGTEKAVSHAQAQITTTAPAISISSESETAVSDSLAPRSTTTPDISTIQLLIEREYVIYVFEISSI